MVNEERTLESRITKSEKKDIFWAKHWLCFFCSGRKVILQALFLNHFK